MLVLCLPCFSQGGKPTKPPAPTKAAPALVTDKDRDQPWPLARCALPKFPVRPPLTELKAGVFHAEVELVWPRGTSKLWLYLPSKDAAAKSLPCVLMAPAGSNLLFGMDLGDSDRAEHLPYVEAGFVVVAYEIEGVMPEEDQQTDDNILRQVGRYTAAWAGLQDARAALEYTLAKVPEVDPTRLFTAGHSSAGTAALLFAAHEPRLRGVAAFMPIGDVPQRIPKFAHESMAKDFPGFDNWLVRCSPHTHVARFTQPLFVFAAEDDRNVAIGLQRAFVEQLHTAKKDVTFETVPEGDHYEPMIDTGIPLAIAWMQKIAQQPVAAPKPPAKNR